MLRSPIASKAHVGFLAASAMTLWAQHPCASCHPAQVSGFLATGMGRSMGAGAGGGAEAWDQRIGQTRFRVEGARQSIERGGLRGTHQAAYAIGSGNHAIGYLVRVGEFLFQSPLSYYTRRKTWDVAPGYEAGTHPDFNRPIIAECLFCHAGHAAPAAGSLNRYPDPAAVAQPITWDRCHGPPDRHLARPSAAHIVNPGKLAPRLRDAVCEQCHLGGEARILNPGRSWHSYSPGQPLEETFSVYVGAPRGQFKVVGHAEQLALSACARKSADRFWCGACHDPHSRPADPAAYYRARCHSCHEESRMNAHAAPGRDCIGCHMPRRKARDSGHAAFTDHFIRRRAGTSAEESRPRSLVAWREPSGPLARRNLGLAYVSLGEKEQDLALLREGGRLLSEVDLAAADADVLASLGLVRFLQDRPADAVLLLERAVSRRPDWAPYYQKLALAWRAAGDRDRAIRVLRRGIQIDPSLEALYHTLAEMETGAARRQAIEKHLRFAPQSLVSREALRVPSR